MFGDDPAFSWSILPPFFFPVLSRATSSLSTPPSASPFSPPVFNPSGRITDPCPERIFFDFEAARRSPEPLRLLVDVAVADSFSLLFEGATTHQ